MLRRAAVMLRRAAVMLRRAAVLKRICDRRRAQNAFKVQCQSFAGMITQDSERSYTDITTLTLSIKNTMPEFLLFSCDFIDI